jgi:uncharacterized protein involved in cysteine biosynthesis
MPGVISLSALTLFFLVAAVATAIASFFLVGKMADQLKRASSAERKTSVLLNLAGIVREHDRSFPRSELMLAFWLSIIFLVVWLACLVFS